MLEERLRDELKIRDYYRRRNHQGAKALDKNATETTRQRHRAMYFGMKKKGVW